MEEFVKTCDQCQRPGKPNDKKKAPLKLVPVIQESNPVEQFHRTSKRLLRVLCYDAGSEWDKHLPSILLALRTISHESTGLVHGENLQTPETLVMEHWMEPEERSDLVTEYMFKLLNRLKRCQEVAINKIEEMQVKRKTWYDKNAVKREFKVEHEIQLVSDQPVRTKPYRMSHRQIEIFKKEINGILTLGIIEVVESDYMSPMILVEVAGKKPRPCID
ncbi:CCHC-type domain-containing protein [Trichonephila clavipes]|nr:CCHC-type domain-containing protein [Trichonephila clavipes]